MNSKDEPASVRQEIDGEGHQIAGGHIINVDVINEGDGFRPDPNNPNLTTCKKCKWPGLSLTAQECPRCGHNYLAEYLAAQQQAQEKAKELVSILGVLAVIVLAGALQIASRTSLGFFEGAALMVLILGGLWWIWIQVASRSND